MRSEFSNGATDNGYRPEPIPPRPAGDDPRMSAEERRIRQWFRDHAERSQARVYGNR
jgi:hypothetical protein